MSKTLETKNKILNLLKGGKKTPTEMSTALGLSKPTIGQHLQELMQMGLIEEVSNQYFRKLKYFQVKQTIVPVSLKNSTSRKNLRLAISSLLTMLVLLGAMFYLFPKPSASGSQTSSNTSSNNGATSASVIPVINSLTTPSTTSTIATAHSLAGCPSSYSKSYNFEPRSSTASFSIWLHNFTQPVALMEESNGTWNAGLGPAQSSNFSDLTKLELGLSVSNSTSQQGRILINAYLFNTLNQTNNVSGSQNWPISGITGCRFPDSPGIAIFKGYYTISNVSRYNSTYGVELSTSTPLQTNTLEPGVYTVLAEDEWGQEAIVHFEVVS